MGPTTAESSIAEPETGLVRKPNRFRELPMARPCSYATPKTEEFCSIDLADLRRWGMLTQP
jgi:hypothetical protein